MQISRRATEIQASPIRKLNPYANQAKAAGVHVYHLNIGQPDIETPQAMMDAYRGFNEKVLAYGPSDGLPEYRKALGRYYHKCGLQINPEEIIVTNAGSEAIIFAMLGVCDPGDEIIVFEPFYTNYNGFATIAGATLVPVTTYAEDGFMLPADKDIEAKIGPKTRAIMICNPGNPTGAVFPKADLERLAAIVKKHNLYLISDEVYREFVYDGVSYTSVLSLPGLEEHAVLVDSISKRYSACGARIGCIVTHNKELFTGLVKFSQARLCPPTIDQVAAAACVDLPDDYFATTLAEYKRRRDLVYDALTRIPGIICRKPQGAFYIIAKLPIKDCEDFALWLLKDWRYKDATVMVAPAEGFYATPGLGKDEIRLAYILNETDLANAMESFALALIEYRRLRG